MLPAPSIARTWNVCGPAASAAYAVGDSQSANAAASSAHSNDESISFALNVNVALVAVVELAGFSRIVVCGGTATVHVYSTGVSSARPYVLSFAATVRVCSPSTRPLYVFGDSQSDTPRPSSSQKNSTLAWSEANLNVALLEAVLAGLEVVLHRRVALGELLGVELALERRAGLGGESERRDRRRARIGRLLQDPRVGRLRVRHGLDRPGIALGRLIRIAGEVERAHLERVRPDGEIRVLHRRVA